MTEIKIIGTKPSKTMVKGFNPTNTLRLEIHSLKKNLNLIRVSPNRIEEYEKLKETLSSYLTLVVKYHNHGNYTIITEEIQDTYAYAERKAEWDKEKVGGYLPTTFLFRMYMVDNTTNKVVTDYKDNIYKIMSIMD